MENITLPAWAVIGLGILAGVAVLLGAFNAYVLPKLRETIQGLRDLATATKSKCDANEKRIDEHGLQLVSANSQITEVAKMVPAPSQKLDEISAKVAEMAAHFESVKS